MVQQEAVSNLRLPSIRLLVQAARVLCYFLILALAVISQLFQDGFINWSLLRVFYSVVTAGLLVQGLQIFVLKKFFENWSWLFLSFVFDAMLVSFLTVKSDLNQSLFLFIYLVLIVLSGLVMQKRGAMLVALICSIGFTSASILGPELKTMSVVFLIVLNNLAFFVVAWLSGYLSDQFAFLDNKIETQSLSLQTIQKLNEAIIATIPSGLINTTVSGEVLLFNLGARQMLSEALCQGAMISAAVPGLQRLNFQEHNAAKVGPFEFYLTDDVSVVPTGFSTKLLRVTRLRQESVHWSEATYLYIFEDMTEMRRLESQVRQSEKLAAVGQLAAGIAHEIRNPLAGISGSIELLSQSSTNEDDRKLTKIILREIDRLNNLISEFLEYAKPDQKVLNAVDLTSLVKEVLEASRAQEPAGLVLSNSIKDSIYILGNRDKLKQAFLNIVINAYQAMAKVENPELEVSATLGQGQVALSLKDNGGGMSESVRARIFEPFMTTKPKGTGLGLAITHKILETHGAQVLVVSAEGRGTEFQIVFPVQPVSISS